MLNTPKFTKGTMLFRLAEFFVNHINFCEGVKYGTDEEKKENKVYEFFYKYWLFPFEQNDCLCCNTVRGLIYGCVIGFIMGSM